jgi:hypothetical protein
MSAKTPIIGGYVRRAKGHLSKRYQPLHIRVGVGTILPIDKPMDICVPKLHMANLLQPKVAKVSLAHTFQLLTLKIN